MALFAHDPRQLTKALPLYGGAAPAGGTAGVFLGGVLTESVDWRWVFFANVPIGLAVLAASRSFLPALAARRGDLDIAGAISVTAALSLMVFAIVRVGSALGLAVMTAVATAQGADQLGNPSALVEGFRAAFVGAAAIAVAGGPLPWSGSASQRLSAVGAMARLPPDVVARVAEPRSAGRMPLP